MEYKQLLLTRTPAPNRSALVFTMPDGTVFKVRVRDVEGSKVRLAIEAPTSVNVRREEVPNTRQ